MRPALHTTVLTSLFMAFAVPSAFAITIKKIAIPTSFQGDWVNVADAKTRAKECRTVQEDGYLLRNRNIYVLTFTDDSIEHRFINQRGDIYLNDIRPTYSSFSNSRITGSADQTYQEGGADIDFPVKKKQRFDFAMQGNGTLTAHHLKTKQFYRCPTSLH